MNKTELNDELRPEYNLKQLRVRKLGARRKSFGDLVRLEPDVMEIFPNAELVNQAFGLLIRNTQVIK